MENRIRTLRKKRSWSLQRLADQVGTSKSQIDKLERAERRLTLDWMMRIANVFDVPAAELLPLSEQGTSALSSHAEITENGREMGGGFFQGDHSIDAQQDFQLPIMGTAKGGIHGLFFEPNNKASEYIRRPANLVGVQNAFAVYMMKETMAPRYYPGEILFINPNKPLSANCFVVVEFEDGRGMVKQYKTRENGMLVLHQFNPDQTMRLPLDDVKNVYRIVSSSEGN